MSETGGPPRPIKKGLKAGEYRTKLGEYDEQIGAVLEEIGTLEERSEDVPLALSLKYDKLKQKKASLMDQQVLTCYRCQNVFSNRADVDACEESH